MDPVLPTTLDDLFAHLEAKLHPNFLPILDTLKAFLLPELRIFETLATRSSRLPLLSRTAPPPSYLALAFLLVSLLTFRQAYHRFPSLLLQFVGVLYPSYRTFRALECGLDRDRWLAYWVVFGAVQSAGKWNKVRDVPGYGALELIFVWWLQSDRWRGATVVVERGMKPLTRVPPPELVARRDAAVGTLRRRKGLETAVNGGGNDEEEWKRRYSETAYRVPEGSFAGSSGKSRGEEELRTM